MLYVQATDEMLASETRERGIAPLKSIRDNHEKIVVARQGSYDTDIDDLGRGIRLGRRKMRNGAAGDGAIPVRGTPPRRRRLSWRFRSDEAPGHVS